MRSQRTVRVTENVLTTAPHRIPTPRRCTNAAARQLIYPHRPVSMAPLRSPPENVKIDLRISQRFSHFEIFFFSLYICCR